MHHLAFWRLPERPLFPSRQDLPLLDDQEAAAALADLRSLVDRDLADVYLRPPIPGEVDRWNVWLGHSLVRGGLRIDLQEWAERRREWSAE